MTPTCGAMVPAAVYLAARRAYVLSSTALFADDEAAREWAVRRWPSSPVDEMPPALVAFWVMSIAAQDGHE